VRLENGTRYIVAIRGLKDRAGGDVPPNEAFRKIRDQQAQGDPVLGPLAARYEAEIFPVLDKMGVPRAPLQLAWDFTTATFGDVTGDLLAMRADAMRQLAAAPPAVAVTGVIENVNDSGCTEVDGTLTVPLYTVTDKPGARPNRDASGAVVQNGPATAEFTVLIPPKVLHRGAGDPLARLIQLGHGFFGDCDELVKSPTLITAEHLGAVFVCTNTWGMSRPDMTPVMSDIAGDPSRAPRFSDRAHQGMVNLLALSYAARGPLADVPELQVGGRPAYDRDTIYYYGNSQGAILGTVYTALAPHVERAYLGVGGGSFGYIMFRSGSFENFLGLIQSFVPDPLDVQKFGVLLQTPMDRVDPLTYAPHLLHDTFDGSPAARRVLMHLGTEDAQVPNVSGDLLARVLGVPLLEPALKPVHGLSTVPAPHDGSAVIEFDFQLDLDPPPGYYAESSKANEVHDGLRVLPAALDQLDRFLRPGGLVEQTCDGVCDPE